MTIANLLTIFRLLIAPLIFPAFASDNPVWVILIWVTAAATDILDGWVARKRGESSELGKILDPLADKLVMGFSFLALVIWYDLPLWMGLTYIIKESVQVVGGAFFYFKGSRVKASNAWGKAGTVLFFIGFFLYFLAPKIGNWILLLGLLVSFIALSSYTGSYLQKGRRNKELS